MAGAANQDPGQKPATADELLTNLMHTGEILDRHHEQGEELDVARSSITARRSELEVEREEVEQALVDDFNARAGKLGMEAETLQDEERRLKQRQKKHQRSAGRLGNQLRELADDPTADRSTVVAYAAFVATRPNFTAAAVDSMGELDEVVRTAAGQPFALIQRHNFAFGRIEEETEGLVVDTGKNVHHSDAIKLPVAKTNLAKHGRRKPYYGWVSQSFDHPRDLYETWDSVLGRSADDSEVFNPTGRGAILSHFNLQEGSLPLLRPSEIRRATDEDAAPASPEDEQEGIWEQENILFTGPAATAFLHRVVDARLTLIDNDVFEGDSASAEFGRLIGVTTRLGLRLDPRKIPAHERFIGA